MKEALHALEEVKQAINLAYVSGYSAGKQQREWVGLTDEDVNRESAPIAQQMKLAFHAGMCVAQKILQERNT
jgi:hypothetical protein